MPESKATSVKMTTHQQLEVTLEHASMLAHKYREKRPHRVKEIIVEKIIEAIDWLDRLQDLDAVDARNAAKKQQDVVVEDAGED